MEVPIPEGQEPEQDPFTIELGEQDIQLMRAAAAAGELAASEEVEPEFRPMVWIACLAAYNDGTLHGDWIDAARDIEEVWADVERILRSSPIPNAEEVAIFDYEGFAGIRIGEYEPLERVAGKARLVQEHGEAFAVWFNGQDDVSLDEAETSFPDALIGDFADEDALAEHLVEAYAIDQALEIGLKDFPSWLRHYLHFDSEGMIRDLKINGDLTVGPRSAGGIWAFFNR